jgi:hypothetical protein
LALKTNKVNNRDKLNLVLETNKENKVNIKIKKLKN